MNTRILIIIVSGVLLLLGTASTALLYFNNKSKSDQATENSSDSGDFEDGSKDEETDETNQEYYGSSTYGACDCGCDCVVDGCNGEICRSKDEEGISTICSIPDKPLPSDLGYSCICKDSKCQWTK